MAFVLEFRTLCSFTPNIPQSCNIWKKNFTNNLFFFFFPPFDEQNEEIVFWRFNLKEGIEVTFNMWLENREHVIFFITQFCLMLLLFHLMGFFWRCFWLVSWSFTLESYKKILLCNTSVHKSLAESKLWIIGLSYELKDEGDKSMSQSCIW